VVAAITRLTEALRALGLAAIPAYQLYTQPCLLQMAATAREESPLLPG
jgi:hypothetical protein